ncbi:hypothetical protein FPSE5266_20318 [Fusarium pseudograminearum]|nr:hypothetical protein FPSE5266_20318 [Fusarium pseudograminearum]
MPPVHGSSPAVTSTSEHFYTQAEGAKRNGWVLYQPPSRTIEILCNSPFIAPSFGGYPPSRDPRQFFTIRRDTLNINLAQP